MTEASKLQLSSKKSVFLIALYPVEEFPVIGESHGICAISGYLSHKYQDAIDVHMYDQQIHTPDKMIDDILRVRPCIIGIAVKMFTFRQYEKFYALLSEYVFGIYRPFIILGNSIAHFSGEEILNNYHQDILIGLGEGELSIGDLFDHVNGRRKFQDIRNILYFRDRRVVRSAFEYLDKKEIPIADRKHSRAYFDRGSEVYIEGSRGCAYCCCSICECKDFLGSGHKDFRWRDKPVDAVIAEMEILSSMGIKSVTFSDEDFFGSDDFGMKRAFDLANRIIEAGIGINFRINARIKSLCNQNDSLVITEFRRRVLETLKKAGLVKIFLGFESGSQSQIDRYRKGFNLSEFQYARTLLDELDIDFELGYICFDPLMSFEELKESLSFIERFHCIDHISSVYKELRVQRGNRSYIRLLGDYDRETKMPLLGPLNFDEQIYPVVKYRDERVMVINEVMKEYNRETYKLYYLIRILTQYSQEISDHNNSRFIYEASRLLKFNDYGLLAELVSLVSRKGPDSVEWSYCITKFKNERDAIYERLILRIQVQGSWSEYAYLIEMARKSFHRIHDAI